MTIVDIDAIRDFHAHVYYDAGSFEQARSLCLQIGDEFEVAVGHMHQQNVGPHPRWSCQLTIPTDKFSTVIPWLALNRNGLTIFIHPDTGDHLADHRDRAMWMVELLELDLSIF